MNSRCVFTMLKSFRRSIGRRLFLLFVVTLILIGSIDCNANQKSISLLTPTTFYTEKPLLTENPALEIITPENQGRSSPTQSVLDKTPFPKGEVLDIPLGMGVYNAENVEVFNRYAREQDVVAARPPDLYLLEKVERGRKNLVFAPRDEPLTDVQSVISEAKSLGVTILGYDLEEAAPKEDLISKEEEMQANADENEMLYVFGPTLLKLERFYDDFARHADIILLQSQHYQTTDAYEDKVEGLIEKIRTSNPDVQIWVQVSVNPRADRRISPDEVVREIALIADQADLIWIYYVPKSAPAMEEVLKRLRG